MSVADIYLSDVLGLQVWQFPNLPEQFPVISQSSKNEEFQTFNNGDFNLMAGSGLRTFSMGFMLALHDYPFNRCDHNNTQNIINVMLNSMNEKFPIRFVFKGNDDDTYTDIVVSVEKFDYNYNAKLDLVFNGDFKQWREI